MSAADSGKQLPQAHMQLARRRKQWPRFELPEQRGSVTVADVLGAAPGPERDEAIAHRCRSVWEAYHQRHQEIADLVRTTLWDTR